ncbi:MAG: NADH-quinone oxidoreductase subunit K [Candidatus Methanospirareceae archaeon]
MPTMDVMAISVIYAVSFAILLVGYLTALSSKDVVRLLISLEMMFGAVFLALLPLFSVAELVDEAFAIALVTIFASSAELLILVAAIVTLDRQKKSIRTSTVTVGGDRL